MSRVTPETPTPSSKTWNRGWKVSERQSFLPDRWEYDQDDTVSSDLRAQRSKRHQQEDTTTDDIAPSETLVDELRRNNRSTKFKDKALALLKTQAYKTEKELVNQRSIGSEGPSKHRPKGKWPYSENQQVKFSEHDLKCQGLYPVTAETQQKLDRIRSKNEKKKAQEETQRHRHPSRLYAFLSETALIRFLIENPRAWKLDPAVHFQGKCRRCRRLLLNTIEARFTVVGILLCIFLPIIGILLMFANREFVCVVCQEIYVYGEVGVDEDDNGDDK